ncbi:MAG: apolipoprotein N-acyltransferase [Thermoanaerobaculia bacterium]
MTRGTGRRSPLALLLAVAAGCLWAACFRAHALVVAPWAALAPTLTLLWAQRPVRLTFLAGVAYWCAALWWIVPTLVTYGPLALWWAIPALLLLATVLAGYWALFAWMAVPLWRRGALWGLAGAPAAWVVCEWLRGWVLGGFPWNLAAYSWLEVPGARALSAWIGAYGVSAVVVLVNAGVAIALARRSWWTAAAVASSVLVLLAVSARWAGSDDSRAAGSLHPVRVIQPNVPNRTTWDPVLAEEDYQRLLRLSHEACDRPALLIWPESAAFPMSWQTHERLRGNVRTLAERGCPVLLNSPWSEPDGYRNSVFVIGPDGPTGRYDKRHLVPFGEYVPGWAPIGETLARNIGSFVPGREPTLLPWAGEELGVAVCYEIVFPTEVAATVQRGATMLVTVTNDAWYGDTAAPWQHLAAARFRAAELHRPVLRAAITGVSAIVDARGGLQAVLGVGEEGVLRGDVPGRSERTLYSRAPRAPVWASGVLWLGLVAASRAGSDTLRRRRRR